jgi:ribosomal protein S18
VCSVNKETSSSLSSSSSSWVLVVCCLFTNSCNPTLSDEVQSGQSHEESSSYIHHACMNGKEVGFKGQQTLKEYISSTARIDSAAANRLAI